MSNYSFYFTIVVFFNYLFLNVLAENKYYMVSIRRNSKDKEYDKSDKKIQNAIDELVNDRMNDIYDIISDNEETYKSDNGKLDKKLEELSLTSQLKKRSQSTRDKNFKFQFINKNRPQNLNRSIKLNSAVEEEIDLIPFESNLVKHICPVSNYYVIIAYLSNEIVDKIKTLPNVISCTESKKTEMEHTIRYDTGDSTSQNYYNKEEIINETHWKDLSIQEHEFDFQLRNTHLSILSQGRYNGSSLTIYDNNYYYPSSAGKGIDIYVIDGGLDVSMSEDDFDTYEGTPDERIIKCDGEIYDGEYHPALNEKSCKIGSRIDDIKHGTTVALSALGKINGVAKKANLHMLATDYDYYDILAAFDYIKQQAQPHKTLVNISRHCKKGWDCFSEEIHDKINELNEHGIIIFVSGGNSGENDCRDEAFRNHEGVITVAAINNEKLKDNSNMENMYEKANYSSYGECISIFAPGTVRITDESGHKILFTFSGTSFASPIAAGVASTIMSEDPDQKYNIDLMKKILIDLSLKDVIKNLDGSTVNRLINNGKRSIYQPPRCDDPSGQYHCQKASCTKYGYCVDPEMESSEFLDRLCDRKHGCQTEYGFCYRNCGKDSGNNSDSDKCLENECCTKNGRCIPASNDPKESCLLENGCQSDYGQCSTKKCGKDYFMRHCPEGECCSQNGDCVPLLKDKKGVCLTENGCSSEFGQCTTKKCGPENNMRKCLEGECCSREGTCVDILEEKEGVCFIENGCRKDFSSQCLSTDISSLSQYDEKYHQKIYDYHCQKELAPYKSSCRYFYVSDIFNKRDQLCEDYDKMECRQFVQSPYTYIPVCENSKHLLKIYDNRNSFKLNNVVCARKSQEASGDFCFETKTKIFTTTLSKVNDLDRIIGESCHRNECRESLLEFLRVEFDYYKSVEEITREEQDVYKKVIKYLSSEECISLNH